MVPQYIVLGNTDHPIQVTVIDRFIVQPQSDFQQDLKLHFLLHGGESLERQS